MLVAGLTGLSRTEPNASFEAREAAAAPLLDARLSCVGAGCVEVDLAAVGLLLALPVIALGRLDEVVDGTTDARLATLVRLEIARGATEALLDVLLMEAFLVGGFGASNTGKLPRCSLGGLVTGGTVGFGAREVLVELVVNCDVFRVVVALARGTNTDGRAATGASGCLAFGTTPAVEDAGPFAVGCFAIGGLVGTALVIDGCCCTP